MRWSRTRRAGPGALLAAWAALGACGGPPAGAPAPDAAPPPAAARPIPTCSPAASGNYLVRDAQQCWFEAPGGRWRIVSHDLHYDTLVVRVVAADVGVAEEVGRRFGATHGERFAEIAVYVEEDGAGPAAVRRVTWTRGAGLHVLDFGP